MDKFVTRKRTQATTLEPEPCPDSIVSKPPSTALHQKHSVNKKPPSTALHQEHSVQDAIPSGSASTVAPSDLGNLTDGPSRPRLQTYPKNSQSRRFQKQWYDEFPFIEYSVEQDAVYCFPCRTAGLPNSSNHSNKILVEGGFKNWKNAKESFNGHQDRNKNPAHHSAVDALELHQQTQKFGHVIDVLKAHAESTSDDRHEYLIRIVSIVQYLAKQGIAFRGHDEKESSSNRGNFLELLELLKKFDPFLQTYEPPKNATYTSKRSQNEVLQSSSDLVIEKLISEIKQAGKYSIMADEAKDKYTQHLSLCVRYVSPFTKKVVERFLTFLQLSAFDAKSMTDALEGYLEKQSIEESEVTCVAQGYDGASVMSGVHAGVQTQFRQLHPQAIYVHCWGHQLNLVIVNTCKSITEVEEFFSMLGALYTCIASSMVNHEKYKEIGQEILGNLLYNIVISIIEMETFM